MSLTRIQPSALDKTLNYTANAFTANYIVFSDGTTQTTAGGGGSGGGVSASGYLANSIIFANTTGYLSNTSVLQFISSNNTLITSNVKSTTGFIFPDGTIQTTAGGAGGAGISPGIVTPGTYGNTSYVPVITVDTYGRVTNISNVAISSANTSQNVFTFITTQGQSTFTLSGSNTYTPNLVSVYVNGFYLNPKSYTATTGTTVVLNTNVPIFGGEIVDIVSVPAGGSGSTTVTTGSSSQIGTGTAGQYLVANSQNSPVWQNRVTKTVDSTPPSNALEGDTWYDTSTGKWSMYLVSGNGVTGAGWIEVGRP